MLKLNIWSLFTVVFKIWRICLCLCSGRALSKKGQWTRRSCDACSGSSASPKPHLSTCGSEAGWIQTGGHWWGVSVRRNQRLIWSGLCRLVPLRLQIFADDVGVRPDTKFSSASSGTEATVCIYSNHACSNGNIYLYTLYCAFQDSLNTSLKWERQLWCKMVTVHFMLKPFPPNLFIILKSTSLTNCRELLQEEAV